MGAIPLAAAAGPLAFLAPIAAPLAIAAIGFKVLGSIFGAQSAARAARQRAAQYEAAAQQGLDESGVAAQIQLEQGDRLAGKAATLAAASGGGTTGSALNVMDDLARQSMFNARSAIYKGQTQARVDRMAEKAATSAGNDAVVSNLVDAGGTLVGGLGKLYSQGQTNSLLRSGGG